MILLALDYDNVSLRYIICEYKRIIRKFDLELHIYESSPKHYHIRSLSPIKKSLAFEVLDYSQCSTDYKIFSKRVGMFPIRIGEKHKYCKDGTHTIAPSPYQLI